MTTRDKVRHAALGGGVFVPRETLSYESHVTRDDLLRAVILDPKNDQPRLVFANWLENNNERPYAFFIRVGCMLAKARHRSSCSPDHPRTDCECCNLQKQHEDLLENVRELGHGIPPGSGSCTFSRGFVETISSRGHYGRRNSIALYKNHPIGRINLVDKGWIITTEPVGAGWGALGFKVNVYQPINGPIAPEFGPDWESYHFLTPSSWDARERVFNDILARFA